MDNKVWDCVVIGGGVAGLVASTFLARSGKAVLVLEKSKQLGGRGQTIEKHGSYLNLGPHAIYEKGIAYKVLTELELEVKGGKVPTSGKIVDKENVYDLPGDALKLLTSPMLSWNGKKEALRFFTTYKKIDTSSMKSVRLSKWLNHNIKSEEVRKFIQMLIRLATYSNDIDEISAGAALRQLQLGNAIYLEDGWQTMIRALKEKAREYGVAFLTGAKVEQIKGVFPNMQVLTQGRDPIDTKNIVSTVSPQEVTALLREYGNPVDFDTFKNLKPVKVACLDLILSSLPLRNIHFALGLEQPFYYSNHSNVTKLSYDGKNHVVHVMKYLSASGIEDQDQVLTELVDFMDRIQPGWENFVIYKRYLPRMTVSHSAVKADKSGLLGRPTHSVKHIPGLYLAGDWVGGEGMLVDASFNSAVQVAETILESS
ncbi:phytoene desaturase family protein [Fredinandcohnia sp. 179-A 10B2 NHS]|uniref:phytoene desaturase family protein n=1 Tax=Fredinandcohnia sp. 179-A 10B2 NHS TaxID=3235176 RepID=UPI00399EF5CF